MFVLRKISGSGVEINIAMGVGYTLITKEANKVEFEEMKNPMEDDCIYAYIVCNEGLQVLPLSNKQKAFVMTESGSTFANVSQR